MTRGKTRVPAPRRNAKAGYVLALALLSILIFPLLPSGCSQHGATGGGTAQAPTGPTFASKLMGAPGVEEPYVTTKSTTAAEDAALEEATAGKDGAIAPLEAFLAAHPDSGWSASVHTNLGLAYYRSGFFSKALEAFGKAWDEGRSATDFRAKLLVDRAVGELARMHARLGHLEEVETLLADIKTRPLQGGASELITAATEGANTMRHNPGISYLCGPKALRSVLTTLGASAKAIAVADEARSGEHGFTLAELGQLADQAGLSHRLVHREPGQAVPVPSVVNWKLHHYAAIVKQNADGTYLVKDPTFGPELVLSEAAIDEEASGFFLLPASSLEGAAQASGASSTPLTNALALQTFSAPLVAADWRDATPDEAEAVYGKGFPSGYLLGSVTAADFLSAIFGSDPIALWNALASLIPTKPGCATGMCKPDAHAMEVSLHISDTPVGTAPPVGPPAFITFSYNQREATPPYGPPANAVSFNVGPQWTVNVLSYVVDNPSSAGSTVSRYFPGGGAVSSYTNYNSSTGAFDVEEMTGATLKRTPTTGMATSYTLTGRDGSTLVYSQNDGSTSSSSYRRLFLTSITDPQGQALTFTYDTSVSADGGAGTATFFPRLTKITDAAGRDTKFCYDPGRTNCSTYSGSSLLVSQVTDPFGRAATIDYDGNGRLSSITDVIGITSTVTYDDSHSPARPTFIKQLTTPYGNTTFDFDESNSGSAVNLRWLETTDPDSNTERMEFAESASGIPTSDETEANLQIPSGLPLTPYTCCSDGHLLDLRNTYFWNKAIYPTAYTAYKAAHGHADYTSAELVHWLHTYGLGAVAPTVESVRHPLESRIWYQYTGEPNSVEEASAGTMLAAPIAAARILDDGSTQLVSITRDTLGRAILVTDALGRQTEYCYNSGCTATTDIDLLAVKQLTASSTYTTIASYSYDSNHNVLTKTDASGQMWRYCYNGLGQLTQAIDPANYVSGGSCGSYGAVGTQYTYEGSAPYRLTGITDAKGNTYAGYTYSSTCTGGGGNNCDLPLTFADNQTFTKTYTRDALDRVTRIDYSDDDGTYETFSYTASGGTHKDLDLLSYTDRKGRTTTYAYDAERRQTSVTDPLSHVVSRAYYANGALHTLTDQNTDATTWDIDVESRPTTKTFANSKTEAYAYESTTSRLHSVTDATYPTPQVKTYSYDKANELTKIAYTGATNATNDVELDWDTYFPRMTQMSNDGATPHTVWTTWSYIPLGSNGAMQLDTENGPYSNDSAVYAYDVDGRVTSATIGGTTAETFTYDELGRVYDHYTGLMGHYSYTVYLSEWNLPRYRTLGGSSTSMGWIYSSNADWAALRKTYTGGTQARNFGLYHGSNDQDPHLVTEIDEENGNSGHPWAARTWTYTYDADQRLLTAQVPCTNPDGGACTPDAYYSYGYDSAGNQTTIANPDGVSGNYSQAYSNVNQMTTGFTHDDVGNRASDTPYTYKFDAENRLVEFKNAGATTKTTYTYDGLGRRLQSAYYNGSTTTNTRYQWCAPMPTDRSWATTNVPHICAQRDGSDTVLKRYYTEGEYTVSGSTSLLYEKDQAGSIRDVVSQAGSILGAIDYSPYGKILRSTGTLPDYRFAGMFVDQPMGLSFSATRAYDTWDGSWLNRDPIAEGGGVNLYEYAGSNPITNVDPSGLSPNQVCTGDNPTAGQSLWSRLQNGGIDWLKVDNQLAEWGLVAFGGVLGGPTGAVEAEEASTLSVAASNKAALELSRQLALELGTAEIQAGKWVVIAGNGSSNAIRDLPGLIEKYGGEGADWTKVSSSSYTNINGIQMETHAYVNVKTGQVVEPRLVFPRER